MKRFGNRPFSRVLAPFELGEMSVQGSPCVAQCCASEWGSEFSVVKLAENDKSFELWSLIEGVIWKQELWRLIEGVIWKHV